jgi:uncharacterized protein
MNLEKSAEEKERRLLEILASMESAIIAFSGGVDSAYLAVVAQLALGERSLAVTGESPSYPDHQRRMALDVVEKFRLKHRFVSTEEIVNPDYVANHRPKAASGSSSTGPTPTIARTSAPAGARPGFWG